jgi:hypothetical protein
MGKKVVLEGKDVVDRTTGKEGGDMTYTADSITILSEQETLERFFWAKSGALAEQYRKPVDWIERGLQACERVNIPHDYFIDRYLRKLTIAKDEGMEAAFFDILKEQRSRKAIARPLASNRL